MSSQMPFGCNAKLISSRQMLPVATTSVRSGERHAPRIIPGCSVNRSFWSRTSSIPWFSQGIPTTNLFASGRGNRGRSCSIETQIGSIPASGRGSRGASFLSFPALAQERPLFGCEVPEISARRAVSRCEEVQICGSGAASGGFGSCRRKHRAAGGKLLVRSSRIGVCGSSSFRRSCEENFHSHCGTDRLLGTRESRRSGGGRWGLAALACSGGACVERRNSSRACCGKAARCASSRVCGLSARKRRSSGKSEGMELFKPQLMDTVPFQFLYEYHTTPLRAVKDSISPICFFGFGEVKPVVEVVQAGDPVLHEPAQEVRPEEIGSARIEKIINDMVATMRNAPGVGLAAPQIGVQLQIIVLEDTTELMSYCSQEECEAQQRSPFDLLVIINPKLKAKSGSGSSIFFEGCLSVEGYRALVERDLEVEVTGLGRDGRPIHVEASGWKARVLQHECDHLAGNLYVDKMVPRTFRTKDNLRLPLPAGCPKPGVCKLSV